MDDTHTYHICYQVYSAPPGVEAPKQDVVPWYEAPLYDEQGKPILDYVLAQDMIAWWAQGEIVGRSKECLGRTDIPIILLRRQLEEQIRMVEQGGEPMNFFREEPGDILYGSGSPPEGWTSPDWAKQQLRMRQGYRTMYHKGFVLDDVDRYGPAVPLIQELHRRIEAAQEAALRG